MKLHIYGLSESKLFYVLGVVLIAMRGTWAADLCDVNTCIGLDNSQSTSDNLNKGLVNYTTSQDISVYQLTDSVSNSLALYNMTSRYLSVFKGLSSALGIYMTSSSYKDESKNLDVLRFTNQLKNNLSILISYTDLAVEDMAWTLYENLPAPSPNVVISPTKTVIYGHGYRVSDMYRAMVKTWRLNCQACGLNIRKRRGAGHDVKYQRHTSSK